MAQKSGRGASLKDVGDEPDYEKISHYLAAYFHNNRNIKSELGLSNAEIRIYRSITGIMDAIKFTRENIEDNNNLIENSIKEGESLIFSLISGKSHPAIEFFESKKSGGRPRQDPLTMQTLIFSAACQKIMIENIKKRRVVIRQIVHAVKGYPYASDALSLENFINRSERKTEKSREDEKAVELAEQLLRKLIKDASDHGTEISALQAIRIALDNIYGPRT